MKATGQQPFPQDHCYAVLIEQSLGGMILEMVGADRGTRYFRKLLGDSYVSCGILHLHYKLMLNQIR